MNENFVVDPGGRIGVAAPRNDGVIVIGPGTTAQECVSAPRFVHVDAHAPAARDAEHQLAAAVAVEVEPVVLAVVARDERDDGGSLLRLDVQELGRARMDDEHPYMMPCPAAAGAVDRGEGVPLAADSRRTLRRRGERGRAPRPTVAAASSRESRSSGRFGARRTRS